MQVYQEEVEVLCLQGVEVGVGPWVLQVGVGEGVGRPCHQEVEEAGVGPWPHLEAGVEAAVL